MAKRHRVACLQLSTGRSKLAVSVLLLVSAILVSSFSFNNPYPVSAAASLTLNPTFASRGAIVSIAGSGFSFPNGTSASICIMTGYDRAGRPWLITFPICSVSGGSVSGSFVVNGTLSPIENPYTARVVAHRGSLATNITAQATFTVTGITINPSIGARGQTINLNGSIGGSDTACSISGSVVGTWSCVIYGSTGGNFSGSFVVSNVATPGPYKIRVTGNPSGVFVEATFTVKGPSITLNPTAGRIGSSVGVNGTGFSFSDTTCTISSPSLSSVVLNPACVINAGTGEPKGNFTVGNVSPGSYVIKITGSTNDFAQATFNVTSGPSVTLSPATGITGTVVKVTGTGYLPTDTACTISGTGIVTVAACSIVAGSGAPNGNFTVGDVVPGAYLITVTGNKGDSAQATFQVTPVIRGLTLYPTNATTGSVVTFKGTGFSTSDTSCVVLSSPTTLLIGTYVCAISSGVATGSFTVGATATANVNWNVTVRGSPVNDNATASFRVIPKISVVPTAGTNGTVVSTPGSGFSSLAVFCNLTVVPNITFVSARCGIAGSSGQVSGSFIVFNAPPGVYLVNVTDSAGYFAGTTFTVGAPSANIAIIPNVVTPGDSVGVVGDGFNPSDTACTITPTVTTTGTPTCSISGGVVAATFTVSGTAASGYYVVVVSATPYGDFASNFLEVTITTITITTSTSTTTSVTSTTATSITTSVSSTLTTTSITNTGVSTYISYSFTTTTSTGQSTTSISTTTTATFMITSFTTTTTSTTVAVTHTLGGAIGPSWLSSQDFNGNLLELVSVMSLLGWVLVRRLAF